MFVGLRGLAMNRIDHNISGWINAEGILGKKLDAMKDRYPVERDIKTCHRILNLMPQESGILVMNNVTSECTIEINCPVVHFNVFKRHAIERWMFCNL